MITHLRDALDLIEGRDEFIHADKRTYSVIDYVYQTPDTFSDPQRLELRGIKFDPEGEVIARPLRKFFNVGERDDTQVHAIDWSQPHVVYEKLDGSMVHPAIVEDRLRLMTRMGITDTADRCEQYWVDAVDSNFGRLVAEGLTPIFEWIGPNNPHIVRYSSDELVLLAARTVEGEYLSRSDLLSLTNYTPFRVPNVIATDVGVDVRKFIEQIRAWPEDEGVVVTFADGYMLKIKADAYLALHKAKDALSFEKDVLRLVLDDQVDDVLAIASPEDGERLTRYRSAVMVNLQMIADEISDLVRNCEGTRKDFALGEARMLPPIARAAAFATWDGRDALQTLIRLVHKQCNSSTSVADVAEQLGLPRWER